MVTRLGRKAKFNWKRAVRFFPHELALDTGEKDTPNWSVQKADSQRSSPKPGCPFSGWDLSISPRSSTALGIYQVFNKHRVIDEAKFIIVAVVFDPLLVPGALHVFPYTTLSTSLL